MIIAEAEQAHTKGRRRCVSTRDADDREAMVRFVIDPDGELLPDILARAPGRGFWIGANRNRLDLARRKSLFARQARRKVRVAENIADQVEDQLLRRCLDLIGLAKRAGEVVAGYDKVATALRSQNEGILLTANDAADDGREKLFGLARNCTRLSAFSRAELGTSLGRTDLVHAFVQESRLAHQLIVDAKRLSGFRQVELCTGALDREGMSQDK